MAKTSDPIGRLHDAVIAKCGGDPALSYTARLFDQGRVKIAQKLGEEAVETVIELVRGERAAVITESADLLYHLVVAWAEIGVLPVEVWAELEKRETMSGLAEKAARQRS